MIPSRQTKIAELFEQAIRKHQNLAIETAQVIEELIQLAKDMRAEGARGEELGMSEDEVVFYDALETSDSAVQVLGDETLKTITRELVATVRRNVTIDWTIRDNVRAQLRVYVKRVLRKYGYPPDKQEKATRTVLEQAEVLSDSWALLWRRCLWILPSSLCQRPPFDLFPLKGDRRPLVTIVWNQCGSNFSSGFKNICF